MKTRVAAALVLVALGLPHAAAKTAKRGGVAMTAKPDAPEAIPNFGESPVDIQARNEDAIAAAQSSFRTRDDVDVTLSGAPLVVRRLKYMPRRDALDILSTAAAHPVQAAKRWAAWAMGHEAIQLRDRELPTAGGQERRAAEWAGVEPDARGARFVVARKNPGGRKAPVVAELRLEAPAPTRGGQVVVYLSDVEAGGGLVFPCAIPDAALGVDGDARAARAAACARATGAGSYLGLGGPDPEGLLRLAADLCSSKRTDGLVVRPKAGSALRFGLDAAGNPDPLAWYGECRVRTGEMWTMARALGYEAGGGDIGGPEWAARVEADEQARTVTEYAAAAAVVLALLVWVVSG